MNRYIHKSYFMNDNLEFNIDYLLKRLLIGNLVNIKLEYRLDKSKIYCLTQLEHEFRNNKFKNQRYLPENLEYINGLKHSTPWIGCGMAYRNIIENAIEQDLPYITICNDDIIFKEQSIEQYEKIINYLENNKNWDIFVGINNITDPYMKVMNRIKIDENLELLQIDMFDSLGFNIYRKSMFERIKKWDTKYRIYPDDTLISSIQKPNNLVILTINPFLVDYNFDVNSTIRNRKNEIQMNKIRICENIIRSKKNFIR